VAQDLTKLIQQKRAWQDFANASTLNQQVPFVQIPLHI